MRVVAGIVFTLGAILMVGATLLAFDTYMTDERKSASRAALNAQLDASADQYEKRHEDGCVRRCGRQGALAHFIVNLRDGIFFSLPFEPARVFPAAIPGWTETSFDIGALEEMLGKPAKSGVHSHTTEHRVLSALKRVTKEPKSGDVRIYRKDGRTIAIGIKIYRKGLHAAKDGKKFRLKKSTEHFAEIDGVLIHKHSQFSYDSKTRDYTAVKYQNLSIYLDGQVEVTIVSDATNEELQAFLSEFDMNPIIADLPKAPASYSPGKGVIIYESIEQDQSDS
ncbi:hypothetical protein SAMN05444358_104207 [Ruegeria halocynthiae]|uniref:Uncharacterized protein n=1 Tax=Ruegeria halocynthiae TaxID=985054 RepID=A0A1H3AK68_9RHOB|nr:hypothetical protein [Ruegeria halocynthiae]SDX30076.1 hypothetical protein SAMN05444358_104207 [Ruegeria halocynthiae]